MSERTYHHGYWYEVTATTAKSDLSKFESAVTVGKPVPAGEEVLLLSNKLIGDHFQSWQGALLAGKDYAIQFINDL